MSGSNFTESGVLNHLFRTDSFAKPSVLAIALTHDVPVETDNGSTIDEVSDAGGYTRVTRNPLDANWDFVTQFQTSGLVSNTAALTWPTASANWGNVSGLALCNLAEHGSGAMLFYSALATPRDVQLNDTFEIAISDLDVLLS